MHKHIPKYYYTSQIFVFLQKLFVQFDILCYNPFEGCYRPHHFIYQVFFNISSESFFDLECFCKLDYLKKMNAYIFVTDIIKDEDSAEIRRLADGVKYFQIDFH